MPPRFHLALGLTLMLASGACGPDTPTTQTTIDRDTFIATYVDLRRTGLRRHGAEISAGNRDRVLARHGVTQDDMLDFADAHGADIDYMKGVWEEVETRLDSARSMPDSVG